MYTPKDRFTRNFFEAKMTELVVAKGLEKEDAENLAGTAEGDAAKKGTLFAFDVKKGKGGKYDVVSKFAADFLDDPGKPFVKKMMAQIEKTKKKLKIK